MSKQMHAVLMATAAAAAALLNACAVPNSKPQLHGPVGNWRILTIETVLPDGQISTAFMGKQPVGIISYQANGLVAVQLMRDPKPAFAAGSRVKATPEELKGAYFGYYAYWGTYTVDAESKTISHQLTASLMPEEVGITYKRHFEIDGQRMVLTTPPFMYDGRELTNRLTWERMKD